MTKYDRRKVDDDENQRILDLSSFSFEPPEQGIYEGTVRYYKANIKWAKIIDGLVSWLATTAVWPEAEDENYFAIQQILIFLQGVEVIDMTPEELKTAIAEGQYLAWNRLAAQVVSGRYTNINVDEEGNVTDPTGEDAGAEIPEDDPETPTIDESKAAKMGGAIAVARGLEKYFDMLDTYYGTTNGTPSNPVEVTKSVIKAYFPNDGAQMDTAIDLYYAYRVDNGRLIFNTSSSFDGYMYCNGHSEVSFNRWLIDKSGFAESKRQVMSDLVVGLSDEFFSSYYAKGTTVPSTTYREAPCEPIAFETFQLLMSGAGTSIQYTTNGVWKQNHRYLIKVTGTYTDPDNLTLIGDGMYRYDTSTGTKTFNPLGFNFNGGVSAVQQSHVPYEDSHVYEFTVEMVNTTSAGIITKSENVMVQPNRTGTLTVEVTDLGEFAA